jgi:hypothetical protein
VPARAPELPSVVKAPGIYLRGVRDLDLGEQTPASLTGTAGIIYRYEAPRRWNCPSAEAESKSVARAKSA